MAGAANGRHAGGALATTLPYQSPSLNPVPLDRADTLWYIQQFADDGPEGSAIVNPTHLASCTHAFSHWGLVLEGRYSEYLQRVSCAVQPQQREREHDMLTMMRNTETRRLKRKARQETDNVYTPLEWDYAPLARDRESVWLLNKAL